MFDVDVIAVTLTSTIWAQQSEAEVYYLLTFVRAHFMLYGAFMNEATGCFFG